LDIEVRQVSLHQYSQNTSSGTSNNSHQKLNLHDNIIVLAIQDLSLRFGLQEEYPEELGAIVKTNKYTNSPQYEVIARSFQSTPANPSSHLIQEILQLRIVRYCMAWSG
jgi:hypothetical protein